MKRFVVRFLLILGVAFMTTACASSLTTSGAGLIERFNGRNNNDGHNDGSAIENQTLEAEHLNDFAMN